jgi:hypothetical protein
MKFKSVTVQLICLVKIYLSTVFFFFFLPLLYMF